MVDAHRPPDERGLCIAVKQGRLANGGDHARRDENPVLDHRVGGDVNVGLQLAVAPDPAVVLHRDSAADDGEVADGDVLADGREIGDQHLAADGRAGVDHHPGAHDAVVTEDRRGLELVRGRGAVGCPHRLLQITAWSSILTLAPIRTPA